MTDRARAIKVIGPGLYEFRHQTPIRASDLFSPQDVPSSPPPVAECRSPRGQTQCSCGMYTLRWEDA